MANDFRGENAVWTIDILITGIWMKNILLDSMANDFRGENAGLTIDNLIIEREFGMEISYQLDSMANDFRGEDAVLTIDVLITEIMKFGGICMEIFY